MKGANQSRLFLFVKKTVRQEGPDGEQPEKANFSRSVGDQ